MTIKAQDSLAVIQGSSNNNSWLRFSDAPHALYHHLAGQAYRLLGQRTQDIAKLRSRAGWKARQHHVRQILRDIVGPFPPKSPLHARVTKTVDEDGYRVENIVYQSQPGYYVTSSLFIPDGLKGRAPAILDVIGHSMKSYRRPIYQHEIINLVKKGFIVFAIDPVGQGERLQYYNPQTGKPKVGGSTNEHSYVGAQAFIIGSSLAKYEIWDGIRAVDYLLTRKEVDPDRLGVTGLSGGGTQSSYIAALDDRIYAAAPAGFITNYTRLIQSVGPQDAEQNFFHEIAQGIDHADLLEVRAPKPTLMITTTRDFFSIQGSKETAKEVAPIFKAYGKKSNFHMVEDDAPHSFTKKNNESMYAFFQKYLHNPGSSDDNDVKYLGKALQVTSTGQVASSFPKGETVFSLNRKLARKEENKLQASRKKDLDRHLQDAVRAAKKLSGYRPPDSVGTPVFAGRFPKHGYAIEKYFVMGEGGDYPIPYLLLVPDKPNGKGLIYLDPAGKAAHLSQQERWVRRGVTVLAPDLLGVGEMGKSDYRGDSYIKDANYNLWFLSILIGRSIVGVQAGDVARLAQLLQKRKDIKEVDGLARRQLGPTLLHAAAFDSSLAKVALVKPYSSYRSIVETQYYKSAYILGTVAGALRAYDLPDLAASLVPRKLLMAGIKNGAGKPAGPETMEEDARVIKAAYRRNNAGGQLTILSEESVNNLQDLLIDWIQ